MATIRTYNLGTTAKQRAIQNNHGRYFNILHKRAALRGLGKPFRNSYTFWIENIPAQMPTISRQISLHGPQIPN